MILNEKQLAEAICQKKRFPLYFLYGAENVLVAEYAERLRSSLREQVDEGDWTDYNDRNFSVQELYDVLRTPSFTGGEKAVMVHDVNPLDLPEAEQKKLLELLDNWPDGGTVIFELRTAAVDERRTAAKQLLAAMSKLGAVVKFQKLAGEGPVLFVERRVKENGGTIDRRLCQMLVNRVGEDLNQLRQETDKLCAFTDGRPIHEEDIEAIVTENPEASVFKIASCLLAGDLPGALQKVRILLGNREDPIRILSVLSGAFIDLYRAQLGRKYRKTAQETAKAFGYPERVQFKVKNAYRDAARLKPGTVEGALHILVETDREMKGGKGDAGMMLETCVMRLYAALSRR